MSQSAAAAAAAASPESASAAASPLPAAILSYLTWARTRMQKLGMDPGPDRIAEGVVPGSPLVAVQSVPGEGCGLVLTQDLPATGEAVEVFRVPASMQFHARHSAVAPALASERITDSWMAMVLALLAERALTVAPSTPKTPATMPTPPSEWSGFIEGMPARGDQPMFWTDAQLAQLQGCSFLSRIHFFDFERDYFKTVLRFLGSDAAMEIGLSSRNCDLAAYKLVNGWIISRAFRATCNPELGPIMLPLVDLFNTTSMHQSAADSDTGFERRINTSVSWEASASGSLAEPVLVVRTLPRDAGTPPLKKGQPLYLPYGNPLGLPNSELLIRYGFVEGSYPASENTHDTYSASLRATVDVLTGGDRNHVLPTTNPAEATEEEEARALHQRHQQTHAEHKRKKSELSEAAEAAAAEAAAAAAPAKSGGGTKKSASVGSKRKDNPPPSAMDDEQPAGAAGAGLTTPKSKKTAQQQRGKKAAAAAAAAALAAAAAAAAEEDDAESSSSSSDSDDDGLSYGAHLDLINSLPVESFDIPASGIVPLRFKQFLAVLLGIIPSTRFQEMVEADAQAMREKTEREMSEAKVKAQGGAAASSAEEDARALMSPSGALDAMHMSTPVAASAAASSAAATAFDPESDQFLDSHSDVLEALFFVLHHFLGCYATTLEEDVKLARFFEEQKKTQPMKLQMGDTPKSAAEAAKAATGAASSSSAASSSHARQPSATGFSILLSPDPSENAARLDLALRVRMSEKRILYRAIDLVRKQVAAVIAREGNEMDDDPAAAGLAVDPDASDPDDLSSDRPDPNILSPSLFKMLANQRRPNPSPRAAAAAAAASKAKGGAKGKGKGKGKAPKDEDAADEEEAEEEEEEEQQAVADGGAAATRFTYTKSPRHQQAKKKRRG